MGAILSSRIDTECRRRSLGPIRIRVGGRERLALVVDDGLELTRHTLVIPGTVVGDGDGLHQCNTVGGVDLDGVAERQQLVVYASGEIILEHVADLSDGGVKLPAGPNCVENNRSVIVQVRSCALLRHSRGVTGRGDYVDGPGVPGSVGNRVEVEGIVTVGICTSRGRHVTKRICNVDIETRVSHPVPRYLPGHR